MSHLRHTADARVARIAGRQYGVVTAEQLHEAGIDSYGRSPGLSTSSSVLLLVVSHGRDSNSTGPEP